MWGCKPENAWQVVFCLLNILLLSSCLHENNHPPIANAGASITAAFSSTVILDGTQSNDVDGDSLHYQWSLTEKPTNSNSVLIDADTATPRLTLDVAGKYIVQLIVNDGNQSSKADYVTITATNSRPVAVISENQPKLSKDYLVGELVSLTANLSNDPESKQLSYIWSLLIKPNESLTILSSNSDSNISLTPDVVGHYVVHLIVSDGVNQSNPQTLSFNVKTPVNSPLPDPVAIPTNKNPVAVITTIGVRKDTYFIGDAITLSAEQSRDPENQSLIYQWSLQIKPDDSNNDLTSATARNTSLVFDTPGHYLVTLQVNDGVNMSETISEHFNVQEKITNPSPLPFTHPVVNEPCIDCHNNATGKAGWRPPLHINASNNCLACHNIEHFKNVDSVDHLQVVGTCINCHNNAIARGQPKSHLRTTDKCDACHSTDIFVPTITVDHSQYLDPCWFCHNGKIAGGRGLSHFKTTENCIACHSTVIFTPEIKVDHQEVKDTCENCHDGKKAIGKISNTHVASNDQCVLCHTTISWSDRSKSLAHSALLDSCENCHNDSGATGQGNNHIPTNGSCGQSGCHSTMQWKVLKPVHHELVSSGCANCHVNSYATQQPVSHIQTNDNCQECHNSSAWKPLTNGVNHLSVVGVCIDCHDGVVAKGQPTGHIIATNLCEACHTTTNFTSYHYDHLQGGGSCYFCHGNNNTTGKNVNHLPTSNVCEACHNTVSFSPIRFDHTQTMGSCVDCHNGIVVGGKTANHIQSNDSCNQCHIVTSWKTIDVHHQNRACTDCHQSPSNHMAINIIDNCQSCHIAATWQNPARGLGE